MYITSDSCEMFSGQPSCKQQMEVNQRYTLSAMQKTSMGINLVLIPKVSFDSHISSHPENKLVGKGEKNHISTMIHLR